MADDSVLVNRENGHADLGDKAATAVSPCEQSDIGNNWGGNTYPTVRAVKMNTNRKT